MKKKQISEHQGKIITNANGERYFVMGNTRTRIVEYFAEDGKTYEKAIEELIRSQARLKTTLKPL